MTDIKCERTELTGISASTGDRATGSTGILRRIWLWLRQFNADQIELQERLLLINRPWEEEFLHWAYDGQQWHLHGHRSTAKRQQSRSVTTTGWCPGLKVSRPANDSPQP